MVCGEHGKTTHSDELVTAQNLSPVYPKHEDREAWCTAVLVFMFYTCIGLNSVMFSVLYVYLTDYFESGKAATGFIGSVHRGITMSFGELMTFHVLFKEVLA